jgi:hexosaminidase
VSTNLIPQPRSLIERGGSINWTSPIRVEVPNEWRGVVATFANDLRTSLGWEVIIVAEGQVSDLVIELRPIVKPEGFVMSVATMTTLYASDEAGVSYGLTTLRQLGPVSMWSRDTTPDVQEIQIPCVDIEDFPTYSWRGAHLDVSRHFFDVSTVCRFIDQIAAHRMNHLHLHLNDDQGWRIEIPAWPRLTEVGSRRRSSPRGHEVDGLDDDEPYGGYFSTNDISLIRLHAELRFVQIVPEIDLPGHAQAVITAYPEFGNGNQQLEVWTRWGISDHVLNLNEPTLAFAEDVVRYVASLFPAGPFHIGGDECPTIEWENSPEALAIMEADGFSDARQLQGLYTKRLAAALHADGHQVIAWDEVLDAEVPDGTTIAAWRDSSKGVEAAQRGLNVIMAPMQFTYFDLLNSDDPDEPVAQAPLPHARPWEKVYQFPLIPLELAPEFHHLIRGAQIQLWTEYIGTVEHLDYMAFPRIAAFSEVAWGTCGDLEDFRSRLQYHVRRLGAMGINFRPLRSS